MKIPVLLLCAIVSAWVARLSAVTVNPLFCDHAVLQQGRAIPVWGGGAEGERVVVALNGVTAKATVAHGRWRVDLPAAAAGGPYELRVAGDQELRFRDVWVGEVWICSGQSNMERTLGPQPSMKPIIGWQQVVAAADLPRLRFFTVEKAKSLHPLTTVKGSWQVSSPTTAPDFSAVAFFFGRALQRDRGVAVGLIHASVGGTPAEAWTSRAGLAKHPDFAELMRVFAGLPDDEAGVDRAYRQMIEQWYAKFDHGVRDQWMRPDVDAHDWPTMELPTMWEQAGLPDYDGVVWFRREFEVAAADAQRGAVLELGAVDDNDTTWVNGQLVGHTDGWAEPRRYELAPGVLKPGTNTIVIRVLDVAGPGGFPGQPNQMKLTCTDGATIPLAGAWRWKATADLKQTGPIMESFNHSANMSTVLYNGMIAPLEPYAMRGVLWYQGEANAGRAEQYQTLFPTLIGDWRAQWGQGEFPFLFVQIAPWKDMPPEIREAQRLTAANVANTAMVVTTDCGDAEDIHPPEKLPVGERLWLAARALAYGEDVEYSGPAVDRVAYEPGTARVHFRHVGRGLVAVGGPLVGFALAGADGVFHPATAVVENESVVVSSAQVNLPRSVRYGWGNVPEGNLFNRDGLPASPFQWR